MTPKQRNRSNVSLAYAGDTLHLRQNCKGKHSALLLKVSLAARKKRRASRHAAVPCGSATSGEKVPLRPFGPAPCGGASRIFDSSRAISPKAKPLVRFAVKRPLRGGEPRRTRGAAHALCGGNLKLACSAANQQTCNGVHLSPATRKKRTPKPLDAAAIRSADKSPARLENGSGARADRMPDKGTAKLLTAQADSRAPFSKWAIKGICPKRVRPHAFSLPFSRRKRKCGIVKGRIAP